MNAAEFTETAAPALPETADVPTLNDIRKKACTLSTAFKLQSHQRFLRRVLSPDSPVRNLLMVHGTGVGKTCTAIQIAEEYILRPEYRDHKVLVLANPAVQESFRKEIFDVNRVALNDLGVLQSTQCTGRRYLEILQRIEGEPRRWSDPEVRDRLNKLAGRILDEFYEFQGYIEFANRIMEASPEWIHKNFDHRMLIVDEAHNLRVLAEENPGNEMAKRVSIAIERLVKTADHMVLVCLTATPMYDSFAEILFYFNLFLWNDRRIPLDDNVVVGDTFDPKTGEILPAFAPTFHKLVQDYVSFVRGESPFTFPFRLDPPDEMISPPDRVKNPMGNRIPSDKRRKYLKLVGTRVSGAQAERLLNAPQATVDARLATIAVHPAMPVYNAEEKQYEYPGEKWLAPSKLGQYAAKFATVLDCIRKGKGVCMVYSNFVEGGARLFSMALEEAGFKPMVGSYLLGNPEHENGIQPGRAGSYVLITQDMPENTLRSVLSTLRRSDNREGNKCRIIVTSPRVSEGVDFRFIRQVHILDPWFNMSRMEQVVGRGMRTCSHSLLDEQDQNCTVYFHVCRLENKQETIDEFMYRTMVETKATQIAKVRRILTEYAMDCPLQIQVNALPEAWVKLNVPQTRSQDGKALNLTLGEMMAPVFEAATPLTCRSQLRSKPDEHVRPLSTYLDVRDEVMNELQERFKSKPIWTGDEIKAVLADKFQPDVVIFLLQDAVRSAIPFKDPAGRPAVLQSRGSFYALVPRSGTGHETLVQRLFDLDRNAKTPLDEPEEEPMELPVVAEAPATDIATLAETYRWPEGSNIATRFTADLRQAYIFDAVISAEQRRSLLTGPSNRWTEPVEISEGDVRLRIVGPKDFKVNDISDTVLAGKAATLYERWLQTQFRRFMDEKDVLSATYDPEQGLKIWIFTLEEGVPKREFKSKSITPTAATSIKVPLLKGLAAWLEPPGFPEGLRYKEDWLPYLYFLIRSHPDKVRWWTPQEWSILESERERLRAFMKEK